MKTEDIKKEFIDLYKKEQFTVGRGGSKMIEILGASFIADEPTIFGTLNEEYVADEITWYESQSTNIKDINPEKQPPKAWVNTANEHGEINSNYGHLIYSDKYHSQCYQVLRELVHNPESRRAIMIYTRPSIWSEYNENGKNDFICTNAVSYYIRDNKVHAAVQMRSNDVVFGYKNDRAWQKYVLDNLIDDLNSCNGHYNEGAEYIKHETPFYEAGNIYWQVQNLHIYERHFHLID